MLPILLTDIHNENVLVNAEEIATAERVTESANGFLTELTRIYFKNKNVSFVFVRETPSAITMNVTTAMEWRNKLK